MALTADGKVAAQAFAFRGPRTVRHRYGARGTHALPHEEIAYAYRALVTGTYDYVPENAASKRCSSD